MAETTTFSNATQILEPFRGVKRVTIEEYFTSGHRTCQGCESALVMKLMVKASGPRTIVLGSTGCMYVANTTYYTTPWVVPWMHTQLGSSGSAALGTAAGLKALMKKGKMKSEPINVIAFCGDGVCLVCRGDDEQGAPRADDRRADVHPLARPVPEGLGLRPNALPRTGRAGDRDRDLPSLRGGGRPGQVLRQDQGHRRGAPAQAGARVSPQAGAVRALHRGGSRVLPGEGGRNVGEVGDSGGGAVPASGRDEGGAVGEVTPGSPWLLLAARSRQGRAPVKRDPALSRSIRVPSSIPTRHGPEDLALGKGASDEARWRFRTRSRTADRRPRLRGGLGTDQADRVRGAGRDRRWRRSDGALDFRHRRKTQTLAPSAHRRQQVRGGGRRKLPRREEQERRGPHPPHHPLQTLHNPPPHPPPLPPAGSY